MTIINALPYTIANGQAVDATPVMADLNQIVTSVNANAVASATLAASGGASLVGYSQGASGSVSRTVAAKLQESVSVLDFGADPTGATFSDTAFADAAAAAWKVLVPAGTYKTQAAISRPAGVTFIGQGRQKTIITATGNYPVFQTIGTSTASLLGGGVQNMTLFGTWGANNANTASMGISESWTNRSIHRDLEIYGCYVGMYGNQGLWQVVWDNITVDGSGANQNYIGFMLDALPTTLPAGTSNAVIGSNLIAQGVANTGFRLVNPNGSKFVNSEAENGLYGWLIGNTSSGNYPIEFLHVANSLADTCTNYGLVIQQGSNASAATDMQFANCWSGNCGTGVLLDGCSGINLTNFQSDGHQGSGLVLNNSAHCVITSFQFNGNNTAGTSGIGDITISGGSYNKIADCVSNPASSASVSLLESNGTANNDIHGCTLFQGATLLGNNGTTIRSCPGYAPANTALTAGASPYTFPTYPYDAMILIGSTGGMTSLAVKGTGISTSAGSTFFVKAGTSVVATWATTAPTFEIIPMV